MEPYIKGRELLLEGSQEKNQKKNSIFSHKWLYDF